MSTVPLNTEPARLDTKLKYFGFKEWSSVCELLAAGRTSIILRRGGIAEGRQGFRFEHGSFFLFPTLFHEQDQKIAWPAQASEVTRGAVEPGASGIVKLHLFAKIEDAETLDDWEVVARLAPHHPWTEEIIRERFTWRGGEEINLAVVRVYRLETPWEFPNSADFGGCKSWVDLPALDHEPALVPVLSEETHSARVAEIRALL